MDLLEHTTSGEVNDQDNLCPISSVAVETDHDPKNGVTPDAYQKAIGRSFDVMTHVAGEASLQTMASTLGPHLRSAANLENPAALNFRAIDGHFFSDGLDGRAGFAILGAPGGDVGEFATAVAVIERRRLAQKRSPFDDSAVQELLEAYLFDMVADGKRIFAMQSDETSVAHWASQANVEDALHPIDPEEAERLVYMAARPENIGSPHLRNLIGADDRSRYDIPSRIVASTIRAFLRVYFDRSHPLRNRLLLSIVAGEHQESAVVVVDRTSSYPCRDLSPLIIPDDGRMSTIVYHRAAARIHRESLANWIAGRFAFQDASSMVFDKINSLADSAFRISLHKALPSSVSVFVVHFQAERIIPAAGAAALSRDWGNRRVANAHSLEADSEFSGLRICTQWDGYFRVNLPEQKAADLIAERGIDLFASEVDEEIESLKKKSEKKRKSMENIQKAIFQKAKRNFQFLMDEIVDLLIGDLKKTCSSQVESLVSADLVKYYDAEPEKDDDSVEFAKGQSQLMEGIKRAGEKADEELGKILQTVESAKSQLNKLEKASKYMAANGAQMQKETLLIHRHRKCLEYGIVEFAKGRKEMCLNLHTLAVVDKGASKAADDVGLGIYHYTPCLSGEAREAAVDKYSHNYDRILSAFDQHNPCSTVLNKEPIYAWLQSIAPGNSEGLLRDNRVGVEGDYSLCNLPWSCKCTEGRGCLNGDLADVGKSLKNEYCEVFKKFKDEQTALGDAEWVGEQVKWIGLDADCNMVEAPEVTSFFTKIAEKKRSKMCSKSVPDSGAGGNEEFLEYGEKM